MLDCSTTGTAIQTARHPEAAGLLGFRLGAGFQCRPVGPSRNSMKFSTTLWLGVDRELQALRMAAAIFSMSVRLPTIFETTAFSVPPS